MPEEFERELKPEEAVEQEIRATGDAEEIICKTLIDCGEPIKWRMLRSASLGKQVVREQQYYEVKEKGSDLTIGYQRWDEEVRIEAYGTEQPVKPLQKLGAREREMTVKKQPVIDLAPQLMMPRGV